MHLELVHFGNDVFEPQGVDGVTESRPPSGDEVVLKKTTKELGSGLRLGTVVVRDRVRVGVRYSSSTSSIMGKGGGGERDQIINCPREMISIQQSINQCWSDRSEDLLPNHHAISSRVNTTTLLLTTHAKKCDQMLLIGLTGGTYTLYELHILRKYMLLLLINRRKGL